MSLLTFTKNRTWAIDVSVSDGSGTTVDLTGNTGRFVVRRFLGKGSASITQSLTGLSGSTIEIRVPPATSESLVAGAYLYEVELTEGTNVWSLVRGRLHVLEEIAE